ncbi:MAG TPA: hypothetical protein DEB09_05490 [Candidatus Magasanikbacteria bacterium]|nr:hypothetical protein [Candidatus Magasanikbacteria bacterium]
MANGNGFERMLGRDIDKHFLGTKNKEVSGERIEWKTKIVHDDIEKISFFSSEVIPKLRNFCGPIQDLRTDFGFNEVKKMAGDISAFCAMLNEHVDVLKIRNYFGHDLQTVANNLSGYSTFVAEATTEKDAKDDLLKFLPLWERYTVAMEDVLLKGLSKQEVLEVFCTGGVDLGVLQKAVEYLVGRERDSLIKYGDREIGERKKYGNLKKINLDVRQDLGQLENRLKGKKIKGNTGAIGNFILNEFRNDFQDRIDASKVILEIGEENNELVIRIIDNGKGMNPEHLDRMHSLNGTLISRKTREGVLTEKKGKSSCIFEEGASGDINDREELKSSGLGVANFDYRIKSMGGKLRVYSIRRETGKVASYVQKKGQKTDDLANKMIFEGFSSGTVFEIRLPIEDK